jgi:hypothetical protein
MKTRNRAYSTGHTDTSHAASKGMGSSYARPVPADESMGSAIKRRIGSIRRRKQQDPEV